MRNFTFLLCLILVSATYGQQKTPNTSQQPKILKVTYTAYPISSYDTPPENSENYKQHGETVALAQSYQHKYSLYIDLDSQESIYKFDTLVVDKTDAQKNINFMINSDLDFVLREKNGDVFKHEKIFQREFYSKGSSQDIDWTITAETKNIAGMNCRKAVAKDEDYLLNVWFTDQIPASSGPVNYFGLPGLVLKSEDFFWTTEIENIEYLENFDFITLKDSLKTKFEQKKKGKEIEEPLLIVKKNALVQSMIDQMK